eukprot:2731030-Rhodomonas_salina.1
MTTVDGACIRGGAGACIRGGSVPASAAKCQWQHHAFKFEAQRQLQEKPHYKGAEGSSRTAVLHCRRRYRHQMKVRTECPQRQIRTWFNHHAGDKSRCSRSAHAAQRQKNYSVCRNATRREVTYMALATPIQIGDSDIPTKEVSNYPSETQLM